MLPLQAQSVVETVHVGNEALLRIAGFSSAFEVRGFLKCHVCDGLQTQALFGVDAVQLGSKQCVLSSCGLVKFCGEFSYLSTVMFSFGVVVEFCAGCFLLSCRQYHCCDLPCEVTLEHIGLFVSYAGYLFLQRTGIKVYQSLYFFVCLIAPRFPNSG